jgi:hypothetical protein
LITISQPNSNHLKTHAESVVKYGLPVQATEITILHFSKCLSALLFIYFSQISGISSAETNLVTIQTFSKASCIATQFIIVASIHI